MAYEDYTLYEGYLFPPDATEQEMRNYVEGQRHAQSYQSQAEQTIAQEGYGGLPAVDQVSRALENIPSSGYKLLEGVGQMVEHPVDTANLILDLGSGAIQLGLEKLGIPMQEYDQALFGQYGQEAGQKNMQLAQKVGEHFANRYGSVEQARKAMIEDPVGVSADAASVLMAGGGLTKMAGASTGLPAIERTGAAALQLGQTIEPITATLKAGSKAVEGGAKLAGEIPATMIGVQSGVGSSAVKEAYGTGVAGGEKGEAFRGAMRGKDDMNAIIDDAQVAIDQIKGRAMEKYQADKTLLAKDSTELSFFDIDKAVARSKKMYMSGDLVKRPNVKKYVDEAADAIEQWRGGDPAVNHTAVGFDDLKQRIMDIYESIPMENRTAQAAILAIKKEIQGTIGKQAPSYAAMMKDYASAMDELSEVRRSLSFGGKSMAETKLKKLQSVIRDNVNTGYGSRRQAVETLDAEGANILPRVAGQAMESFQPQGAARMGGVLPIPAGLYQLDPWYAAAMLPFSSPRVSGEVAHKAGQAMRPVHAAGRALKQGVEALDTPTLMNILYQMSNAQQVR